MGYSNSIKLLAVAFLMMSATATAQDPLVPEKEPEEKKVKQGWDFLLTPGASVSLSDNRSVIGQPEGLTMTVGVTVNAGAFMREGVHEWRSTLGLTELFTHTPELGEFIKTTDLLKIESVYLYHLIDWLGPFAKLNIDTVLLEGFDVRSGTVVWNLPDGTQRAGQHLRLTDGFEPLTLKETAGFFAKPVEGDELSLESRLGFGGVHVFADGLAIADDDATPEIDVVALDGYSQAGGVLDVTLWGNLYDKKLVYKVSAEVMMPFVNDLKEGDDRNVLDLTNVELTASLTFKVFEWLSVDYVFRALRQPQLLDEWQIQNNLLLTASYSFFKPEAQEGK